MATYTAPTTRTTGALISASIWNTDIVENLKYFKDAPVFDGDISVGDDIFLTSTGAVINFASGDVTITHSTNTLTFAGAASGYIFNDGNVGIGVTPSEYSFGRAMQINGAAFIGDASVNRSRVTANAYHDGAWRYLQTNSALMYLQDSSAGSHEFFTAPSGTAGNTMTLTSRFSVLNGGNIAIGATARLYLDGVAGTGDTYIEEYAANEVRLTVGGSAHSAFNATGQFVYYNPPTTASAANAYIAQTDYIRRSTSSIRYKHDIATLDGSDALAAVMAMRPVTYRGKTDADQRRFIGFIAEEMQEIAPLLCTYDEGGESGTPNYVTYDRVTAYLVAVVQQQQTEINALKARIH